ncbi:NAD(P)-dependent oxidoreductase [Streptacidiphilus sp. ASG 303]|uniref:NAD-dependent epimerase/dehydratase family protein n=1 Tax=Streptacidiphilus sp. ASG 303 TaxID=2896847 RepID=UPI001E35FB70|nr:NAD(P)-dependent oxidoreductase [Streptacidiphilus sp. ASG 303]MCD0485141.1 NAD(P)-dependent oxidoreductase [Streptacidiphilus sp. ASG 303]
MSQNDPLDAGQPAVPAGLPVVVLGATGFVGRHVCRAFAAAGARVVGVARNAPPSGDAFRPVLLDLAEAGPGRLARLLADERAEVVVNAAGAVWGVTEEQLRAGNVELTRRLVDAVAASGRRPRLVHLGSVHEYGRVAPRVGITEDLVPDPVNPYGRSKLLGSQAVLGAARDGLVDAVVLRVVNVYGPDAPRGSLLGMIACHLAAVSRARAAGLPAPVLRLSPLRAHRDFVDVRDVADAVVAAARAELDGSGPDVRLVNIGGGTALDVRRLVERLIELGGLDARVVEEQTGGGQRGDVEWQQVDISRARRLLGWSPRRPMEQSLRDLLATAG